jgi:hypothetical protein
MAVLQKPIRQGFDLVSPAKPDRLDVRGPPNIERRFLGHPLEGFHGSSDVRNGPANTTLGSIFMAGRDDRIVVSDSPRGWSQAWDRNRPSLPPLSSVARLSRA